MKALQGCAPSEVKMQQPGVVDPFLLSKGEKKKAKSPPPDFILFFIFFGSGYRAPYSSRFIASKARCKLLRLYRNQKAFRF